MANDDRHGGRRDSDDERWECRIVLLAAFVHVRGLDGEGRDSADPDTPSPFRDLAEGGGLRADLAEAFDLPPGEVEGMPFPLRLGADGLIRCQRDAGASRLRLSLRQVESDYVRGQNRESEE